VPVAAIVATTSPRVTVAVRNDDGWPPRLRQRHAATAAMRTIRPMAADFRNRLIGFEGDTASNAGDPCWSKIPKYDGSIAGRRLSEDYGVPEPCRMVQCTVICELVACNDHSMNPDQPREITRQFEAQGYFSPIDVFGFEEM